MQGISLAVNEGKILALLGRKRDGKVPTLRTNLCLEDLQLTEGVFWLDGQQINRPSSYQATVAGIGLVPEASCIIADLTVEENLQLAQITEPVGCDLWRGSMTCFPTSKNTANKRASPCPSKTSRCCLLFAPYPISQGLAARCTL